MCVLSMIIPIVGAMVEEESAGRSCWMRLNVCIVVFRFFVPTKYAVFVSLEWTFRPNNISKILKYQSFIVVIIINCFNENFWVSRECVREEELMMMMAKAAATSSARTRYGMKSQHFETAAAAAAKNYKFEVLSSRLNWEIILVRFHSSSNRSILLVI